MMKKAELISTAVGPLLATAAHFTHGIFQHPVEYRDGEFGMFNGAAWVPETMFGGAKRALLHAALQCALGARSPCRIILMDELATIDVENTKQFLDNVQGARLAGHFEQFIGMTPRLDECRTGFTYHAAEGNSYTTE